MSTPEEELNQTSFDIDYDAIFDEIQATSEPEPTVSPAVTPTVTSSEAPTAAPTTNPSPTSDTIESEKTLLTRYLEGLEAAADATIPGYSIASDITGNDIPKLGPAFIESAINEVYSYVDPVEVGRTGGVKLTEGELDFPQQVAAAVAQGVVNSGVIFGSATAAAAAGASAPVVAGVTGVAMGVAALQGGIRQLAGVAEEINQTALHTKGREATEDEYASGIKAALPGIIVGRTLDTASYLIPVGYGALRGTKAGQAFQSLMSKVPGINVLTPAGSKLIATSFGVKRLGKFAEDIASVGEAGLKIAAVGGAGEGIETVGEVAGADVGANQTPLGTAYTQAITDPEVRQAAGVGAAASILFAGAGYGGDVNRRTPNRLVKNKRDADSITRGLKIIEDAVALDGAQLVDSVDQKAMALSTIVSHIENPLSPQTNAFIPADRITPQEVRAATKDYGNIIVEDTEGGVVISHDPKLLNGVERTIADEESAREQFLTRRAELEEELKGHDNEIIRLEKEQNELFALRREIERQSNVIDLETVLKAPGEVISRSEQEADTTARLSEIAQRLEELQGMNQGQDAEVVMQKVKELNNVTKELSRLNSLKDLVTKEEANLDEGSKQLLEPSKKALQGRLDALEMMQTNLQEYYNTDPRSPILDEISSIDEEVAAIDGLLTASADLDRYRTAGKLAEQKMLAEKRRDSATQELRTTLDKISMIELELKKAEEDPYSEPTPGITQEDVDDLDLYREKVKGLEKSIRMANKDILKAESKLADIPDYDKINRTLKEQPSEIYKDTQNKPIKNTEDLALRIKIEKQRKEDLLQELKKIQKIKRDLDTQEQTIAYQELNREAEMEEGTPVSIDREFEQSTRLLDQQEEREALLPDRQLLNDQARVIDQELNRIDNFLAASSGRVFENFGVRSPIPSMYDPILYGAGKANTSSEVSGGQIGTRVSFEVRGKNATEYSDQIKARMESYGPKYTEQVKRFFSQQVVPELKDSSADPVQAARDSYLTRDPAQEQFANIAIVQAATEASMEAARKNTDAAKAFAFINRNFTSNRGVGPGIRQLALETGYSIDADLERAGTLLKNLDEANSKLDTPYSWEDLNKAVVRDADGIKLYQSMTPEVQDALQDIRSHVDEMSQALIDSGALTSDLVATFDANKNLYLNRSYALFDKNGEDWIEAVTSVDSPTMRRWVGYISKHIKRGPTETKTEYGERLASETTAFLRGLRGASESSYSVSFEDLLARAATDKASLFGKTHVLKKRGEIAPELMELLGVKKNLNENYLATVMKQSRLLRNYQGQQQIAQAALDIGLMSKAPDINRGITEAVTVDSPLSPFNGLYTTPEFNKAYATMDNTYAKDAWVRAWVAASATPKMLATVYSPITHVRNFVGNTGFMVMNGHVSTFFDTGNWRDAINSVVWGQFDNQAMDRVRKGKMTQEDLTALREMHQKYTALGLMRGFDVQVFADMLKDVTNADTLQEFMEQRNQRTLKTLQTSPELEAGSYTLDKLKSLGAKLVKGPAKAYAAEDAFFKIMAFHSESNRLKKRIKYQEGLKSADPKVRDATIKELETEAARLVRDTLPSYDMVSKGVATLRNVPIIAPFVVFHAEAARNTYNTVRIAKEEIASGDPEARKDGYKRLAGTATAMSMYSAIAAASAVMAGMGEEEEQALRTQVAPWDRLSNLFHLGRGADGNYTYLNLDTINPLATISNPALNMAGWFLDPKDRSLSDVFLESLSELTKPYIQEDILSGSVIEALNNHDSSTGRALYDAELEGPAWTLKAAEHVAASYIPGFVKQGKNVFDAFMGARDTNAQKLDPVTEIASIGSGMRAASVNPTNSFGFAVSRFNKSKKFLDSEMKSVLLSKGTVSDRAVASAVNDYIQLRNANSSRIIEDIMAAQRLGVPNSKIRERLKSQNIKADDINAYMSYRIPPLTFSETMFEYIKDAPPERRIQIENALGKSMRSRLN